MIYFNNAASSYPKPPEVIQSIADNLAAVPYNHYRENIKQTSVLDECREQIAKCCNITNSNRVIFTSGATESCNIAINGIVKPNTTVIATAYEHNAILRPMYLLEKKIPLKFKIIYPEFNEPLTVEHIRKQLSPEVGLICINHVSNVTGTINDVISIIKLGMERHIVVIIDGAQAVGSVPVNLQGLDNFVYIFTGHKGWLGPRGIGGFILGDSVELEPWKVGGSGIHSDLPTMPDFLPLKYEPGTLNVPGIAGLTAGLQLLQISNHYQVKKELVSFIRTELAKIPAAKIYSHSSSESIVSFNLDGWEPDDVGYILKNSYDIILRTGLHCAPLIHTSLNTFPQGVVRVSVSGYNTVAQVEFLITAIKAIAK